MNLYKVDTYFSVGDFTKTDLFAARSTEEAEIFAILKYENEGESISSAVLVDQLESYKVELTDYIQQKRLNEFLNNLKRLCVHYFNNGNEKDEGQKKYMALEVIDAFNSGLIR
ncbi:hypothetical protein EBB07_29295 [Paenibacillaceae bacterium]|nr:hypothetical protein EBB07_29295 [Paenibacillaceae bacterium]